MKLKPITILNGYEYFAETTEKIAATKPGDRVGLMSMSFDPTEQRTKPLIRELIKAAKRGVRVQINIDAFSFLVDDARTRPTGPLFTHKDVSRSQRADYKIKYETLEKLRLNGGNYCITNMPKRRISNPFAGRSHIKFCIINDSLYVGGSNLSKSWQVDLTVRIDDKKSADFAFDFILKVAKIGTVSEALSGKDIRFAIDNATTLYIDAGQKKQSQIYSKALTFLDEAKQQITLTCQFFPGDTTADHLAAAIKRNVKVSVYFHASKLTLDFLSIPHQIAALGNKFKYPKILFANPVGKNTPRLHAKLIATENGAMIGSHNYVTQGINFGTAETMVFRRDPEFAKQAIDKLVHTLDESRINKSIATY